MSDEASEIQKSGDGGPASRPQKRPRGLIRRGGQAIVLLILVGGIAVLAGFFRFAGQATDGSSQMVPTRADGIVVFTGGKDRIAVAANLLARGKGRRLLISGVNPVTQRRDLEELAPELERLSRCCIDLGRQARDTIGNARETAQWAHDHGFRSLLVVTSAYHLPRSLSELSRTMPDATLTGVPVVSARLGQPWWRDGMATRLLISEYGKYLASLARLTMLPDIPGATLARTGG